MQGRVFNVFNVKRPTGAIILQCGDVHLVDDQYKHNVRGYIFALAEAKHMAHAKAVAADHLCTNPDSAQLHETMGILHMTSNAPYDAIKSFQEALQLNPLRFYSLLHVGDVLFCIGEVARAKVAYLLAAEISSNCLSVTIRRACMEALEGREEYAVKMLQGFKGLLTEDECRMEIDAAMECVPAFLKVFHLLKSCVL